MDTSGVDTTSAVEQNPACPKLWVVIPCYNEEAVIPETSRRLTTKMHALLESGRIDPQSHVLLIDNGSRDATWSQIGQLHAGRLGELEVEPELFRGLSLAHNAGHQGGLYAGLMHALDHGCDCTISLDADLQDDIEAIDEMLAKHAAGAEVVYGVRNNRDTDTAFKRGNCTFVQGNQHLNSECALLYARERYSYSSGDRHRGQNQQQIITALIAKISDPHYLVRYSKILESAQDSFESSLSFDEITSFARYQLSELRAWKVESISLDGTGAMMPTYSMGAQLLYVMQPNVNTITNAQKKINDYLTTK